MRQRGGEKDGDNDKTGRFAVFLVNYVRSYVYYKITTTRITTPKKSNLVFVFAGCNRTTLALTLTSAGHIII